MVGLLAQPDGEETKKVRAAESCDDLRENCFGYDRCHCLPTGLHLDSSRREHTARQLHDRRHSLGLSRRCGCSGERRLLYWVLRTPGIWRGIVKAVAIFIAFQGCVFALQGINILPGSSMTGDIRWAYRGAVLITIGITMFLVARRKPVSLPN